MLQRLHLEEVLKLFRMKIKNAVCCSYLTFHRIPHKCKTTPPLSTSPSPQSCRPFPGLLSPALDIQATILATRQVPSLTIAATFCANMFRLDTTSGGSKKK